MVPHPFHFPCDFFAEPKRFKHFKGIAIPEEFLLEIESWPDLQGEDAVIIIALQAVVLMRLKFVY